MRRERSSVSAASSSLKPGEITALEHARQALVLVLERAQRIVQHDQLLGLGPFFGVDDGEVFAPLRSAAFFGKPLARVVAQYLAHHAAGEIEEMTAVFDARARRPDQAQIALVDEAGRAERAGIRDRHHMATRKPAQVAVDQAHQIAPRSAVAVACREQELGELAGIDPLDFQWIPPSAMRN